MTSDWTPSKLSDALELVSGGTPKTTEPAYWGGDIPWLSVVDFNNGYRHVGGAVKSITKAGLKNSATTMLNAGDVIISARGTVGALAQLTRPMAFNQSCYGVRGKENVSNTDYLYYLLKHTVTQLQAVSHGAVFDTITRATFELIDIALPGLAEQAEIASVLGALDDRIENLRATNETLEAIVQTLFKSWFVDFDPVKAKAECRAPVGMDAETAKLFPSEFEESELGPIPKGWATRKADELFEVGIGKTPPRKEPQWFSSEPKNVPWVSIRDMGEQGSFIAATNEYLTTEAVERFNVRLVPDKTVLLSFKLTVGRVSISDGPVTTNEAIAHFKPLEQSLPYTYLFEYLRQFNFEALGSTSSIAEATNSKVIRGLPILTPSPGLAAAFHVAVTPLFDGMRANQREQKALTQIRDQLLPKLISGELRLPGFGDNAE